MQQLWALGTVFALLLGAIATGGLVLTQLRVRAGAGERTLYALGIGLGVQAAIVLGLSALGWMQPAVLWIALLIPAAVGARELRMLSELALRAQSLSNSVTSVERFVALGVALAVLVILFVGAMVPVTDWDSLMYHLRLPKQFLEAGRLHLPADGNHLAFLGLFQFLYVPLLAVGADAGPALLNAALTAMLGVTLVIAGSRLFSLQTGLLAAVAVWGSSSLLLVGTTPRVDVALTTVLAIAHLAALRVGDDDAPWAMGVTALLAGVALGMKYHALPYLGALVPIVCWGVWQRAASARAALGTLARGSLLAALMVSPWMVKNIAFFDAPLYPFFTTQRIPPFIAEMTGSVDEPSSVPRESLRAVGRAREPISLEALVFRPASLTVEVEAQWYTRNYLFAALPLLLFFWRDRRLLAVILPGLAYLTFTLGYFNHTNLRYIIPALPMLALGATELVRRSTSALGGAQRWRAVLAALALCTTYPALKAGYARLVSVERVQVALGVLPPELMLNREIPYAVAEFTAENTPDSARILMLWDARGYYFTRTVLQDNLLTNWPLLHGIGATERCLAGTGITHVMVNHQAPRYYEQRGVRMSELSWDAFPAFAQKCLEPMVVGSAFGIYRVR
jgi:hypothetical protein